MCVQWSAPVNFLGLYPVEFFVWQSKINGRNTRCTWAGGTFFPVVLLCQFLVLAGNRHWFYILMYLEYNTVVMLCYFFGSGGT